MFDLNGSDTNWLVYADYLEDQGIDATHIREGVAEVVVNTWHYEDNYFYDAQEHIYHEAVGNCGYRPYVANGPYPQYVTRLGVVGAPDEMDDGYIMGIGDDTGVGSGISGVGSGGMLEW